MLIAKKKVRLYFFKINQLLFIKAHSRKFSRYFKIY